MTKQPDLTVVWYSAPATGPAWFPLITGDADEDVEACRERLRKRFHGNGGVETKVIRYVETKPALKAAGR